MDPIYNCEQIIETKTTETKATKKQDFVKLYVFIAIAAISYFIMPDATKINVLAFLKKYSTIVWIVAAIVVVGLIISSIISVT